MSEASGFAMAVDQVTSLREAHPYLDDAQWDLLEKMDAINGRAHTEALLLQGPDEVAAHIARFQLYESALERHVLDVVTARVAAAQAAAPSPAPSPAVTYVQSPAPPEGPKPVRVTVSQYAGEEGENLIFWQRENELAMAAARIRDERQKITFAISNMKGRAKTWALTCETSQPGFFQSWASLVAAMKAVFQPPNVAHRQRAAFLASSQGDRELYAYVQELRQLRASMAANTIAEDVMMTVFMDNMRAGPAKAAVFREEPTTLDDAFVIALREDYVQRLARGQPVQQAPGSLPSGVPAQPPAEAMDVSLLDLSQVDLATMDLAAIDVDALHIKCFTCSKMGHFQRDCPRNRGSRPGFRARRGNGRGRRAGNRQAPTPASQGNVGSQ
jgi:hypothetical protein